MEDLKQIQEFFSKPLNEGKQLDIEDFAKVVQAVTQTGHPVTVLLVPKWNEIEVLTGMNAPDDMLFDLSNAIDSLGYGRNDIIIAADSSNLSRREYSDIRRVNGGHKDYFEEAKVEEAYIVTYAKNKGEKPASVAYKLRGSALAFMRDLEKDGYTTMLTQRPVDGVDEVLDEYNSGLYFDPDKYVSRNKAKEVSKTALDKVRDAIKKAMTGDYKPSVTEAKPKKGHGEKISREVFSKLKGKTINYKGADYKVLDSDEAVLKIKHLEDGDVTTINLRQFNLKGMIDEILETIELGRQLEEGKLCPKGEAYRKRRMAAGEKSSAYLSGRAVKVCKGQMSGKKKK